MVFSARFDYLLNFQVPYYIISSDTEFPLCVAWSIDIVLFLCFSRFYIFCFSFWHSVISVIVSISYCNQSLFPRVRMLFGFLFSYSLGLLHLHNPQYFFSSLRVSKIECFIHCQELLCSKIHISVFFYGTFYQFKVSYKGIIAGIFFSLPIFLLQSLILKRKSYSSEMIFSKIFHFISVYLIRYTYNILRSRRVLFFQVSNDLRLYFYIFPQILRSFINLNFKFYVSIMAEQYISFFYRF